MSKKMQKNAENVIFSAFFDRCIRVVNYIKLGFGINPVISLSCASKF